MARLPGEVAIRGVMRLWLETNRRLGEYRPPVARWLSSEPFVVNSQGVLVHRPKTISVHRLLGKQYLAVTNYCNLSFTGTKKFTFTSLLDDDRVVCCRCEENAIKAGLPSSSKIVGGHAHIGGVKAVKFCCKGAL